MSAGAPGSRGAGVLGWPVRHPASTLLLCALCVALSILGIGRIRPNAAVEAMLGDNNAAARALSLVLKRFQAADEMLVLVRLPQEAAGGEIGVRRLLEYAAGLEKQILATAGDCCDKVTYRLEPQTTEFVTQELAPAGLWYLDDGDFAAVRQRLTREGMEEQFRRNEAMMSAPGPAAGALAKLVLRDPLRLASFLGDRTGALRGAMRTWKGGPEFISEDGRSLLARIAGKRPPSDLEFAQSMTDAVGRAVVAAGPAGLRVDLAGSYAIAAHSARQIRADITSSVVQTVILLQILFIAFYRNPLSFVVVFAPVAVGIFGAFGLHGLVSREISPLTGAVGAMLAGLGIDYGIHYLSHIEAERGHGMPLAAAAELTGRRLGGPMSLACGSAVAAFAVLCVSRMASLRDFALVGAVGLTLTMAASFIVIPAMLALLPGKLMGASLAGPRVVLSPMASWVAGRRGWCAGTTAVILAAAVGVLVMLPGPAVAFERDLRVMHPQPNPPLDTQAEIGRLFGGGSESLLVYLHSPTEAGLVEAAHAVGRALRSPASREGGAAASFGLDLFLPDPSVVRERAEGLRALDGERVAADFQGAVEGSSFEPGAFAGYADFLRTLVRGEQLPDLATLRRYPALAAMLLGRPGTGGSPDAVTTVFMPHPLDTSDARAAAVTALRGAIAEIPGATLTGLPVLGFDAERTVRADLTKAVLLGAPLVIVLLFLYFRRPADVGLVAVPAVFSLVCLLAFMKLRGDSFNMANMATVPLMIGLGVDCGIFLVSISRQCRAERQSVAELVRRQGNAAHAMFMTSAPNVLGLLTLTTTATPAIRSMGWSLGLGVAACWTGSIFLLSPWLVWAHERWTLRSGTGPR